VKSLAKYEAIGVAPNSTEILEGEIPAIAETVVLVELDMRRHLIGPAITGPADDHRLGLLGPELVHVRHEGRADGAADKHRRLARTDLVQRLPQRLRHVEARHFCSTGGRTPVARNVDRHAAEPCREPRHLVDPAGLVHRIGMNEGHHRARTAHALVIERSVDIRHDIFLC